MATRDHREYDKGDFVPLIGAALLFIALIVSGFNYWFIRQGSVLLLYAVIVQMWTIASGSVYVQDSHIEFLLLSAGAIATGFYVEWVVDAITGEMLAIQALALAILISRLYVNAKSGKMIRWHDPIDFYVVYIPCAIALLFPVVLFQLEFNPILGFDPDSLLAPTRNTFFVQVILCVIPAVVLYGRIEEDWTLKS